MDYIWQNGRSVRLEEKGVEKSICKLYGYDLVGHAGLFSDGPKVLKQFLSNILRAVDLHDLYVTSRLNMVAETCQFRWF